MSDLEDGTAEQSTGAVGWWSGALEALRASVGAAWHKNAVAALNRLCTAGVDHLVGRVRDATAERHSESQARIKLTEAATKQLAKQMEVSPEYVDAAMRGAAGRIVRERINVDQIAKIAMIELTSDQESTGQDESSETKPISEDWLNGFEGIASKMSSAQMRLLFGKILAKEIRQPGAFSLRTVALMGELDNRAAELFRVLCSVAISTVLPKAEGGFTVADARVISLEGSAGSNSLQEYGLHYFNLCTLQDYQLIVTDLNGWRGMDTAVQRPGAVVWPFKFGARYFTLLPKTPNIKIELKAYGPQLSTMGRELLSIVDIEPNTAYSQALPQWFDRNGFAMVESPGPTPWIVPPIEPSPEASPN